MRPWWHHVAMSVLTTAALGISLGNSVLRAEEPVDGGDDQGARFMQLTSEGRTLFQDGQYAEGAKVAEQALAVGEELYGPHHAAVAASVDNLGQHYFYLYLGRSTEAEALYQRALGIAEEHFQPDHPQAGTSLHNLAVLYEAQERYTEAKVTYERALEATKRAFGSEHPNVALVLEYYTALLQKVRDTQAAEALVSQQEDP